MPTNYIKKLHSEGHGSISHLESEWEKAKASAKKQGKGDNFSYITTIFKNMVGASTEVEQHLEAKSRLLSTAAEAEEVKGVKHGYVPPKQSKFNTPLDAFNKKILANAKKLIQERPELVEKLRNEK